ncbi:hypothetical protein RhiirC2_779389 [Rhizophagus irregularis]|uniref:Uncharacterized protein n=1 Tax=Rhizophagus irregularis TaxID=588596 RepID=A0A2N1N9T9_9GLOM|nr:hypothetical protein RhiirC2_793339 [Rhizophagus irregularis]PKK63527.1 hypothetical protein RhiirC2_788776 [Rhizophagus irregularis]PKK70663.1 hypothetical protein RhiirC2_779389 [Rhizophagus irregularis]
MEYTNLNTSVGVENQPSFQVHNVSSTSSSLKNSKIHNNPKKNSEKHKPKKNDNNNNTGSTSTTYNININNIPDEEHTTNLHVINTENQYYIDYLKIGTINIQGGYKSKLTDLINYFVTHNFSILGITETQYCVKQENNKLIERFSHPTNKNLAIYIILDANGDNKGSGDVSSI